MVEFFHPVLTRRQLIGTSAAALAASALPPVARAQAAKYRRWEITDPAMPPRVLTSYKAGIEKMLALPPTDPRNWYRNAFVHLLDCPHGNWWFLTWHRAYLGWLEITLRELSGDKEFALPYWDWTKTQRVPAAMFDGVLDPNNAGYIATFAPFKASFDAPVNAIYSQLSQPQNAMLTLRDIGSPADFWNAAMPMFFNQPNARGLTAANPNLDSTTRAAVSARTIESALGAPYFAGTASGPDRAGFGSAMAANHSGGSRKGVLESQPHDNVHGAMGDPNGLAFMVDFLSPVDPIFFLHHGNLDRLWDVWTRKQIAQGRPPLPVGADYTAWANEQFLFFNQPNGTPTNAGYYANANMTIFDYDYSPGFGEDQVLASTTQVTALPAPRRFSLAIPAGAASGNAQVPAAALQPLLREAPPRVAEITLNLQPADQGRRFRVLVSAAGGSPVLVGGIAPFGHAHGPATFTVPLPENLAAGAAAGANVPLDIRVEPVEPPAGASPAAAARMAVRAAAPAPVTAITVQAN